MSVQNSYGLYYGKLWLLRETNSDLSGRTLLRPPSTRFSSQLEVPIKIFYFDGECQFGYSLQFIVSGSGVKVWEADEEIGYTFLGDCCWEVQMQKNGVTIKRRNSL